MHIRHVHDMRHVHDDPPLSRAIYVFRGIPVSVKIALLVVSLPRILIQSPPLYLYVLSCACILSCLP